MLFSYFILCKKEYQEIKKIILLETKIWEKNYYFSCISMNNREYEVRPQNDNVNRDDPVYFPFSIAFYN